MAAGREAEAASQFEWLERQPSDDHLAAVAVRFRRGLTGDRAAVLSPPSAAERAMAESDEYWSYLMAAAYALVGEADQALSWLEHAVTVRGWVDYVYFTRHDRFLESLRPSPAVPGADGLGAGAVRAVHRRRRSPDAARVVRSLPAVHAQLSVMRIATWNVNSLKARLEKVSWWLERARPDVLLMQETKLADAAAPVAEFRAAGYELAHHGEGQWNGVAIASRVGIADVVTNFGEPLRPARTPDVGDDEPLAEARMIAATCGGVRVVSLYAPNGRSVGSTVLRGQAGLVRAARPLARAGGRSRRSRSCSAATSISPPRTRTSGTRRPAMAGPTCHPGSGTPSSGCAAGVWWTPTVSVTPRPGATPGGITAPGTSTRTSACGSITCWSPAPWRSAPCGPRSIARPGKGKPIPSDHAPLVIDLDRPGHPFDAGWEAAEARIAARGTRLAPRNSSEQPS